MKESTEGTPIWKTDFDPSKVPIVSNENGALDCVSYKASAAAIFIGCCSVMMRAVRSPETETKTKLINMMMPPSLKVPRAISISLRLMIRYAEIPATTAPAVNAADGIVWKNVASAVFCVSTALISISSARPLASLIT